MGIHLRMGGVVEHVASHRAGPRARRLAFVAASIASIAACGPNGLAAGTTSSPPTAHGSASPLVLYAGQTTQRAKLALQVDRHRSVVTALRFSISYLCRAAHGVTLRGLILRPDDSWAIVDRSSPDSQVAVMGFSDWFSGPNGHDFHITGTLSADGSAVTGTLHSLLRGGRAGRCDSGHLRYRAVVAAGRFPVPALVRLTRSQYRRLPSGTTIAAAERVLGAPNDRDIFAPANVILGTLPSGVPGAGQTWLDYRWRGHPHHYFQFFFRAGRLLSGEPGRSVGTIAAAHP